MWSAPSQEDVCNTSLQLTVRIYISDYVHPPVGKT